MEQKIRFNIQGMTCQACANRIEKVLNKKDFIKEANVNFASEEAQVIFNSHESSIENIANIIEKTGYHAIPQNNQDPITIQETHVGWRLWLLLIINIPFIIGMIGMFIQQHSLMLPPIWQLLLASIVQLWLAIPLYKSAWASISVCE